MVTELLKLQRSGQFPDELVKIPKLRVEDELKFFQGLATCDVVVYYEPLKRALKTKSI